MRACARYERTVDCFVQSDDLEGPGRGAALYLYADEQCGRDGESESGAGTVSEEGTPVSATNLNTIEEGLQHLSVAHDLAYSELQALLRDAIARIEVLEAQVAAL